MTDEEWVEYVSESCDEAERLLERSKLALLRSKQANLLWLVVVLCLVASIMTMTDYPTWFYVSITAAQVSLTAGQVLYERKAMRLLVESERITQRLMQEHRARYYKNREV